MYKLIRFYNQNRKQIIKIILIIVFIIGIIQLLNYLISKKNNTGNNIQTNTSYANNQTSEIVSNKSLVSGQGISSTIIKKDNEVTYKYNLNDFLTTYNKINKTNYYTLEDKSVNIVFTFNNEKINDISIDATSIYNLINNTEYKMIQYKILVEEVSKDDTTWIKEKLS